MNPLPSTKLSPETVEDKKVKAMINTWDIVTCLRCGKSISMLKAIQVQRGFICKEQPCHR
jgi:hypothetical protein